MKPTVFFGALRALIVAVAFSGVFKNVRLVLNGSQSGGNLKDSDDALAGAKGLYSVNAFNALIVPLLTKLNLVNEYRAFIATTADKKSTPANLATFLESQPDHSWVGTYGAPFLTAIKIQPATAQAALVIDQLSSRGILGVPVATVTCVPVQIGRGNENGGGKVREMLNKFGITGTIATFGFESIELTSIDTSNATDVGALANVATVADPFADLTPPVPAFIPLTIADPTTGVTSAELDMFFNANGATDLPKKKALLATRGITVAASANAAATTAAAMAATDKLA